MNSLQPESTECSVVGEVASIGYLLSTKPTNMWYVVDYEILLISTPPAFEHLGTWL